MPLRLLLAALPLVAQPKPPIDSAALNHWPHLITTPTLSATGNYVAYSIGMSPDNSSTILQGTTTSWEEQFAGILPCWFSADEHLAILLHRDTLLFIHPGTDSGRTVSAASFQWADNGHWCAYETKEPRHLILIDLQHERERNLGAVTGYGFDPQGKTLCLNTGQSFACLSLKTQEYRLVQAVPKGEKITAVCFDAAGEQLAFIVEAGNSTRLWCYRSSDGTARQIATDSVHIAGPLQFNAGGNWIFFGQAAISTDGRVFRRLEDSSQRLITPPGLITGDYAVIRARDQYYLLSLLDGHRRLLGAHVDNLSFSPTGHWLVFYDRDREQYMSCETLTGMLRVITAQLPHSISSDHPHNIYPQAAADPAGWWRGEDDVLLYDNYDLWAIDPANTRPPINLTDGYGYAHHVKLRLITADVPADTLLLTGFNVRNKYNGFFRVIAGRKADPECLTMGPYTFYRTESQKPHRFSFDDGMPPQKAARANVWIVKRESATEAPNLFLSSNLQHFTPLTRLTPPTGFNWLTSELINYTQLDGRPGQGILYKPENFNPAKRYPVIFNIYEQYSHRLYEFPPPGLSHDNLNIPWFVSRGYLVFTPDIDYQPANRSGKTTGEWAYNSVIAAVHYLKRLPFVDAHAIGIQGHSLGAAETLYLLTHAHCFAAAAEMAGPTDPMSDYLSPGNFEIWESGQARLGATLWQRPDLYLKESTVLHADRISAPVLIVHNKRDGAVPWQQAEELYLALRRLDKPVWLVQYPGENHTVTGEKAAMDYTLKLTTFFDHYLKGQPLPPWMDPGD